MAIAGDWEAIGSRWRMGVAGDWESPGTALQEALETGRRRRLVGAGVTGILSGCDRYLMY
jgi:hypothetical protein